MAFNDARMCHTVDVNRQLLAIDSPADRPGRPGRDDEPSCRRSLYIVRAGERHEVERRRLLRLSSNGLCLEHGRY